MTIVQKLDIEVGTSGEVGVIVVRLPGTAAVIRVEVPYDLDEKSAVTFAQVISRLSSIVGWTIDQAHFGAEETDDEDD